jgi:hypothetical protein
VLSSIRERRPLEPPGKQAHVETRQIHARMNDRGYLDPLARKFQRLSKSWETQGNT